MTDRLSNIVKEMELEENYFDHIFLSINVPEQSKYYIYSDFNKLCLNSTNLSTILNFNIRSFNANSNSFFGSF